MASYLIKDTNGVIWTPTALIRWPNLFVPSLPKGADPSKTPQFSVTAVLSAKEPDFEEFRAVLWEELDRACVAKHGANIAEMRQRGRLKLAVKRNNDPEVGKMGQPGFKERPDGLHFGATTQFKPPVNDMNGMGMSSDRSDEIYDGMFGQIGVTAWGWTHPTGGKGVSLNLVGVVKRFDGDRLGGAQADMSAVQADDNVPEGAKVSPAHDVAGGGAGGAHDTAPAQTGGGGGNYGF